MQFSPGELIESYEIVALVGRGGMGEVYKARDTKLSRTVALKVLPLGGSDRASAGRFQQEARAASALSHPNVCHIYGLGVTPSGDEFIAMEYIEGETLRSRLARGSLTIRETLGTAIQVASALSASHAVGVVHRDVKPDNIMLKPDGLVKVLDFGLAKLKAPFTPEGEGDATRTATETAAGVIVGTVAYMSPEQARGQAVDARTDVWSTGALIYEMVAGRSAFVGATGSDMIAAILEREPPPLPRFEPDVPAELVRIVAKALRKNRDERYQTAKDLLLDLNSLRSQLERQQETALESAATPSRRRRVFVYGAALAVAAVALGASFGVYRWWNRRATPERTTPPQFSLQQLTNAEGLTFQPAISRDGRLVAYASDRAGENLDLWVQQVAGGEPLRLTTHGADDYQPAFSPDATTIVYRSDRGTGGIYRVSALGGTEQLVAPNGRAPRVSPDGRWIAYWIGRPGSGAPNSKDAAKVFVIATGGGTPRQLAPDFAFARYPIWSPDGGYVLFFGNRLPGPDADWCLASLTTTTVQCLGAAKVIGEEGELHEHHAAADWVGEYALYQSHDRHRAASDLFRIRVDVASARLSGTPERLTSGPGFEADPVMGQSGEIVFSDVQSTSDIWTVRLDPKTGKSSGQERQITSGPADEVDVKAAGDGSKLVFSSNRAGDGLDVWLRDLRTLKETRLTTGHIASWPALDSRGERVAYLESSRGPRQPRRLHLLTLDTGQNDTVCTEKCGSSTPFWFNDGSRVLTTDGNVIRAFSVATRKFSELVKRPPYKVWEPNVNAKGDRLLFLVREHETLGRIVAAPLRENEPVEEGRWVTVSADGSEDKPRWSADGRIAYFTSERDGFRCIWGQRIDPAKGTPVGAAFAAHHSHAARRSLKGVSLANLGIAVTTSEMFFNQEAKTGNLWIMRPDSNDSR